MAQAATFIAASFDFDDLQAALDAAALGDEAGAASRYLVAERNLLGGAIQWRGNTFDDDGVWGDPTTDEGAWS